jgi:hypothetical protein
MFDPNDYLYRLNNKVDKLELNSLLTTKDSPTKLS